jgi:Cu+-exporting ATPase
MMMKLARNILMIAFTGLLFLSCNEVKNEKDLAVNIKKISLNIEGMTCEIGCAKTIESKLSKAEGVEIVSISFDDKKGIVSYDANKTDKNKIVAIVQEIAGGDLYKVTDTQFIVSTD